MNYEKLDYLAGTVVASWFLTQEVAGSNSLNSMKTFRKNSI